MNRTPVEATPRRAMTPARKRRIWEANGGRCYQCSTPVPVDGPGVTYDHRIPLGLGGAEDDDNPRPACGECDAAKTPRDISQIAKAKRQAKMATKKPKGRLKGRGFPPKGQGPKMRSRPFSKRGERT